MNLRLYTLLLLFGFLVSCKPEQKATSTATVTKPASKFKVTKSLPHDPEAFTQGLIFHNGKIIEGTGLNGTSWISVLDPVSLEYDKKVVVPKQFFGEGITIFNGKIYQLTYKNRVGFIYDAETFKKVEQFDYDPRIKEGWGITHDGTDLIISDGTANLYYVDVNTLKVKRTFRVQSRTSLKSNLNELEYINGHIYANVWQTNIILKINPETGDVLEEYDLKGLYQQAKNAHPKIDVLNGIAYHEPSGQLIVTGKYWPNYFYLTIND